MTPRVISLTGKHMLIVGLGAVGQELARKAKAFDMRVTGISRSAAPLPHVDRIRPRAELSAACAEADVIVVSATYDPAEGALLTKAAIDWIGPHGIVINIARGPLVDEGALMRPWRKAVSRARASMSRCSNPCRQTTSSGQPKTFC